MARDIKYLASDISQRINRVGLREATNIIDAVLQEMDSAIPVDTWRLIDSGFGYVNGKLVAITDKGRSHDRLDIMPPNEVPTGKGEYALTIIYHTPKPVGEKAKIFKSYGGEKVFDYAPYVLEGRSATSFVRQASFSSRRAAALRGLSKRKGTLFSKTKLNAAIDRGMERGLTRTARQIVRDLSEV